MYLAAVTFEELLSDPSGTEVSLFRDGETSRALLFEPGALGEDWSEELEIWLETAEDVVGDEDLIPFAIHPVGPDTQVERLLYVRTSKGGHAGPIFALDVDGTAVPDSLHEWAPSFAGAGFRAADD